MTKADLIDEVSRLAELTRKDSEVIVETIFDSVVRSLRAGDKIEIRGFGSFRTRQRKPRVGTQSQDRRARGSSGEEDSVLQAQQGIEGSGKRFGCERGWCSPSNFSPANDFGSADGVKVAASRRRRCEIRTCCEPASGEVLR